MEYSVNKDKLGVCKAVFKGCLEQSVDLDFNLPDYCPDIQKILKCQIYPRVISRNVVGDRLNVEGVTVVSLLYLDAEKLSIRCCEHTSPFSNTFNLKKECEGVIIFTKTKVEYINCRAVTQRRVDIHGAFSICATLKSKEDNELICEINEDSMEQQKKQISVSNLISIAQQQFSINETIELPSDLPPIEAIIKSDIQTFLKEYRSITNKLIVNAEAKFNLLYISNIETGEVKTAQFNIPISHIVDAEGIEDNCDCDINIEVLNHDMQQKLDGNGENTLLGLDIKMAVSVLAYEPKNIELLNDVYSTKFETEKVLNTLNLSKFYENIQIIHNEKCTIESNSDNILEIIDIWGEMVSVEAKLIDNEIKFFGKINMCVLAINEDHKPMYFERLVDFENNYDWNDKPGNIEINPTALIVSLDSRVLSGKNIDILSEIKIAASIYSNIKVEAISDVIIDEEKVLEKDTTAALTIYYANKGENIWDIARKYCTSVESIKAENDLELDEIKEHCMILIPM